MAKLLGLNVSSHTHERETTGDVEVRLGEGKNEL